MLLKAANILKLNNLERIALYEIMVRPSLHPFGKYSIDEV